MTEPISVPARALPRLPLALALGLRPLPLAPLGLTLGALMRRLTRRHPDMLRRLGDHAACRFLIDPSDLPFVLLLDPARRRITAHRRHRLPVHDARIAGRIAVFLAMLHGAEDGDALFFSRDLAIDGDTAAVLALRNAIDDAELDLGEEIAGFAGPLSPLLRQALTRAERLTGLVLHRIDAPGVGPGDQR